MKLTIGFLVLSLLMGISSFATAAKQITHIRHESPNQHIDNKIHYKTWDGSYWWAKLEGRTFYHSRNPNFSGSHTSSFMDYKSWDNQNWRV